MDHDAETGEVNVRAAVREIAQDMARIAPSTKERVREEDIYTRPVVSDYEERGTEAQVAALYGALASARGQFTPFTKSRTVTLKKEGRALYSFDYAPMEELLAATTPALSRHGLIVLMPFVTGSEETTKQLLIVAHAQGGRLVFKFEFNPYSDEKAFGGQTTYLQRYCYRSVLVLAADGDMDEQPTRAADGDAVEGKPKAVAAAVEKAAVTRPTGSERLQLRNGQAQAQPAQQAAAKPSSNGQRDQATLLGEMLTLAKKVGLTKRSIVAHFVWDTLNDGHPFDLGDEFCKGLTVPQLETCLVALTERLPKKAAQS